jgi:release factor glutamine methyltransferase
VSLAAGQTLDAARRAVAATLAAAGIEGAAMAARLIVEKVTGLTTGQRLAAPGHVLNAAQAHVLAALMHRRLGREPLARILGEAGFHGLMLEVVPATLVPRADTETLVDAVLARAPRDRPLRVLDVGTGTGAILIALLAALPLASGIGTDIDVRAVDCARRNADRCGVGARALLVTTDLEAGLAGRFDLVVSNPPYIASHVIAGLEPEVRDGDPHLALDGGPDGLALYRRLAGVAARRLAPGGLLAVEIGHDQGETVPALLAQAGLAVEGPLADLGGMPRVVLAQPPVDKA